MIPGCASTSREPYHAAMLGLEGGESGGDCMRAGWEHLIGADRRDNLVLDAAVRLSQMALKGAAHRTKPKVSTVTVTTEHKAVLDAMRELERDGFEVTDLDVKPMAWSTLMFRPPSGPTQSWRRSCREQRNRRHSGHWPPLGRCAAQGRDLACGCGAGRGQNPDGSADAAQST